MNSRSWSPAAITQALGRAPDRTREIGERHGSLGRRARYSRWAIAVPVDAEWPGSGDEGLSRSVVALGDDLARRLGRLPAEECDVTLSVVQEVHGSDDSLSQGLQLRVEAMRWLVLANAEIDLDQYFYDSLEVPDELSTLLPERQLAEREQELGPDHPDTLAARFALARAHDACDDLARALPLYEQCLAGRERVLGPDDPGTAVTRNALANAAFAARDLGRALPLYEQSLADRVRLLGPDDPGTLDGRHALADAYRAVGDLDRAVALHEWNLANRLRVLGPTHLSTLDSRRALADARRDAQARLSRPTSGTPTEPSP